MSAYIDLSSPDYFHDWKKGQTAHFKALTTPQPPKAPKPKRPAWLDAALIAAILLSLFVPRLSRADMLSGDKFEHAGASALITGFSYVWWRAFRVEKPHALLMAVGSAAIMGIAKETFDPTFDGQDLAADAFGIAVVAIPIIAFDF